MSEKWMKERSYPPEAVNEVLFWAMLPDMVLKVIGYHNRPMTHLEEPGYEGCAIHSTRKDLSVLYASPLVPVVRGLSCAAKVGLHLHLVQDRAYDAWISQWVDATRRDDGTWAYACTRSGEELDWWDVAYLKRWSWRCAWAHEFGEDILNVEVGGEHWLPEELMRYVDIAEANRFFHPEMKRCLGDLWKEESVQTHPPAKLLEYEDEMYEGLVRAWTAWEAELL